MVEHNLAKVGVASSSLVFRSRQVIRNGDLLFLLYEARTRDPLPEGAVGMSRLRGTKNLEWIWQVLYPVIDKKIIFVKKPLNIYGYDTDDIEHRESGHYSKSAESVVTVERGFRSQDEPDENS